MNSTVIADSRVSRAVSIWLLSTILVIGCLGNAVIVYIYGFVSRQRFLNFQRLLLTVAFCDLLRTITGSCLYIYWNARGFHQWDSGPIGCKLFPAFWSISTNIVLGLILLMIIDRSRARISAGRQQFTWIQLSRGMCFIVVLSVCRYIPMMHHYAVHDGRCLLDRRSTEFNMATITLTLIVDGVYLLIFSFSFCYVKLHFLSRRRRTIIRRSAGGSFNRDLGYQVESLENSKIVNRMAVLFMIFVFPYDVVRFVDSLLYTYREDLQDNDFERLESIFLILSLFGGCTNLVLYTISSKSFREDLVTYIPLFRLVNRRCYHAGSTSSLDESLDRLEIRQMETPASSERRKGFDDSHHFSLMNN